MTSSQFLDQHIAKLRDLLERGRRAAAEVDQERLNHRTVNGEWSPAQVYQHMILSHAAYESNLRVGVSSLPLDPSNAQARNTFFGRNLAKGAGPGTNVPAPGPFRPPDGPQSPTVVEDWAGQTERLVSLLESAKGRDINRKFFRNPMMPLFGMNVADCASVIASHTERHVLQIEERLAGSC